MWKITKDLISGTDEQNMEGTGSKNLKEGANLPYKFRLLDDDGEVYFEGIANSDDDDKAFGPLDDFGMPGFGCTEIQYWRNGKWETL